MALSASEPPNAGPPRPGPAYDISPVLSSQRACIQ